MAVEYDSRENYSLCIAWSSSYYYKYFRIADYDPQQPGILKPSKLESDFASPSKRRDNPDHLYHPQITVDYYGRTEDYFVLQWRPDPEKAGKQLTRVYDYSEVFTGGLAPKEVIIVDGSDTDSDIRETLHDGFPFSWFTTRVFYLAYKEEGNAYVAIRCEKDDFILEDGRLKLKPRVSNFKKAMTVPKVRLSKQEIIWSRHHDTGRRGVYSSLGELTPIGRLPLWPLSDYADEYVRWFIRQEESVTLTRADRQRIVTVIRQALDRPDMLEQYTGEDCDIREVEDFKLAISRYAQLVDDPARRIICAGLIKDEAIHDECVKLVLKDSQDLLDEKQRELADLETEGQKALEAQNKELESLEARAISILADIETAETELETARKDRDEARREADAEAQRIESLHDEENRALAEIESNFALRLGLRAAASSAPQVITQSNAETGPKVTIAATTENTGEAKSILDAVSKNMTRLGITSIADKPDIARTHAALSVIAGATTCGALAIPSPLASPIADALSIALSGKRAAHIAIPTDYKNAGTIRDSLPHDETVIVFDNVIDPVNESALFTLTATNTEQVYVFPFVSHGSARLLAKEIWDRVYMPCVESLIVLPGVDRSSKFFISKSGLIREAFDADEVLDTAKELSDHLHNLSLPGTSFIIPAIIKLAVEEDDNEESGSFAIVQHLAMASSLDSDSYDVLADVAPDDSGLKQLFVRLGFHVG